MIASLLIVPKITTNFSRESVLTSRYYRYTIRHSRVWTVSWSGAIRRYII